MALTDDIRKAVTDPKPLYFAAGTADLVVQQAKRVPELIEKVQAEAPERFEAVRSTDPKAVQEKAAARAKEVGEVVQAKVSEVLGSIEPDLKKLGETAQDLALRSVGVAAEYAVKAREKYDEVAERGEQAVKTWRGEAAEEIEELAIAVEGKEAPEPAPTPVATEPEPAEAKAPAKKPAAKKAPARKTAAKKTAPSAE
ncbi:hypothetical protein H9Y04_29180 [Streptomyces sp. TRM66268-LWL]|uniref:Heparin-binding hemagglutinin n=1 Tax=Streptomyces polyasparticus TaxID=2767826 RepID=A0ABR7SMF5_9ACTN|nr:hypothetical protein [Streptomyces polyasparticus]MBC9716613.1 hypothetical protein [Streptomyces polyasparticus]